MTAPENHPAQAIPEDVDVNSLFGQLLFARRQYAEMWGRVALARRLAEVPWWGVEDEQLNLKQAVDKGYAAWIKAFPAVWALQQHLYGVVRAQPGIPDDIEALRAKLDGLAAAKSAGTNPEPDVQGT